MKTPSRNRNNQFEDEPNESRIFTQRGIEVEPEESPNQEGGEFEDRDLLEESSVGREATPSDANAPITDGKEYGHGFGIGTEGGLIAEHKADTGNDSGIRREPESGGGPESTGP